MIDKKFSEEAIQKFVGCDSDELAAGTPEAPSIWIFGIEHGRYVPNDSSEIENEDNNYSISTQMQWSYNQKAFKILAVINGYSIQDYKKFAEEHKPFVRGSKGYFKGNLYPFACHNVNEWPEDAAKETGISNKYEYQQWCQQHRLPAINRWVQEYKPRIFIGVGTSCRDDFAIAVFGEAVQFREKIITINSYDKKIYYFYRGKLKLVVIPHFSGPSGLNSNESLQMTGNFISEILKIS